VRIIYAGIDLGVTQTEQFEAQPVLDPTGRDYLYTRFAVTVRALINGQAEVIDGFTPATGPSGIALPPGDPPPAAGTVNNTGGAIAAGGTAAASPPPPPTKFQNGPFVSYGFQSENFGSPVTALATEEKWTPPNVTVPADRTPTPVGQNKLGRADYFQKAVTDKPGVLPANPGSGAVGVVANNEAFLRRVTVKPVSPVVSHTTIRQRLELPRQPLWVFAGAGDDADVLLQCPAWGFRCDARGTGPTPKLLSITEVHGDKATFEVAWSVECFVNETEMNGVPNPTVLLSNQFRQYHVVDQDSFLRIRTEGTAIFREDYILKNGVSPDAIRPLLFLPIPPGFERGQIEIGESPELGCALTYVFEDKQVYESFAAGPYCSASRIEYSHRQAIVANHECIEGALSSYQNIQSIRLNQKWQNQQDAAAPARRPGAGSAVSGYKPPKPSKP
jgi:hypothetical protein